MSNLSDYFGRPTMKHELLTGSGTWTKPAQMIGDTVLVSIIGGGGGGAYPAATAANQTGGCGGVAFQRHPYVVGATEAYACGAGGSKGATASTDGSDGTESTFGTTSPLTAAGGTGGSYTNPATNLVDPVGTSGAGDTGSTNYWPSAGHGGPYGEPAGHMSYKSTSNYIRPGGGGLMFDGTAYGTGGKSVNSANNSDGANGAILLEWWETV